MKRVFTIIFAIAIFVACNPNKRIVSTVPIKTNVMGIELCEPTTTSKIEKILNKNTDHYLYPLYEKDGNTTFCRFIPILPHLITPGFISYGGLSWKYILVGISEESKVYLIGLVGSYESIETAKQQYEEAVSAFTQKYGRGNESEDNIFWTDENNSVSISYGKGSTMGGSDRYFCTLSYSNIALSDRIEADNQSDI